MVGNIGINRGDSHSGGTMNCGHFFLYILLPLFNPAMHLFEGAWPGLAQERIIDRRDPFAIEIPAIKSGMRKAVDEVDFHIPAGVEVTRFRVWLLEPYGQNIGYNNFTVFLNGASLTKLARKQSDSNGKYLIIDLKGHPDLALKADKNVIEVRAREADTDTVYRASFILLPATRGIPQTKRDAVQVTCQEVTASTDPNIPLFDPTIPRLDLTEPTLPIDGTDANALSVRISGKAIDRPGDRLTLLVNGRVILSSPAESGQRSSGKQGRSDGRRQNNSPEVGEINLQFNQLVNLDPADQALIIEVRDRQQNRTSCTIPVTRSVAAGAVNDINRKFALVVGISDYGSTDRGLGNLSYAHRDAEKFADWLRSQKGGGFHQDDIVLLTNQQATLGAVRKEINRFLTMATSEDLIYLFLAGHGGPDPFDPHNYYFLLHDSKIAELKETAYPMKEIGDFLNQKRGRVRLVSFIDTCHSSRITSATPVKGSVKRNGVDGKPHPGRAKQGERSGKAEKRPTTRATMVGQQVSQLPDQNGSDTDDPPTITFSFDSTRVFQQTGWTVITSAGANEEARESSQWGDGHGVFTWSLLEGLREGLADLDKDCQVTAAELAQYAAGKVRRETNGMQNPRLLPGSTGNMILASTPKCVK